MAEETGEEKSISSELSRLGKQVADAINTAWQSEDRKKLQSEVTSGLDSFGAQVSDAMRKASESDAATQIRDQTEKVSQIRQKMSRERSARVDCRTWGAQQGWKLVERLEVTPQPLHQRPNGGSLEDGEDAAGPEAFSPANRPRICRGEDNRIGSRAGSVILGGFRRLGSSAFLARSVVLRDCEIVPLPETSRRRSR
jgi:hypothetical protein